MSRCCKIKDENAYLIFCPACKMGHKFDNKWTFNGNYDWPTFRASMLYTEKMPETNECVYCCHSFVTDGKIEFLGDCTHEFAGKTIELPDSF